jgi:hypothetical protein
MVRIRRPIFRDKLLAPINRISGLRRALRQHPYKKIPHLLAKNSTKKFTQRQNSPEGTVLTNTTGARPEGSLDIYFYNLNNFSNFNKL